jgi:phosphoribosylformylglycinamidine synthase II
MEKLTGLLKHYRLSHQEWQKICQLLGREPFAPPNVEWALFSALWSEHCSYKSSKIHLRKFARTMNSTVKTEAGENAGVVDLGRGEKIAFKMESHNHPSFIEPYQGAATGVGGILRDIFTMGARPIALANYLCFGMPQAPRMTEIMDGVVRGISGYGNCVGVPTVTGQTQFDESYNQNVLVNAMAVGLLNEEYPMALSKIPEHELVKILDDKNVSEDSSQKPLVVYVGAKTGRDGVHGAAMASESFDDNSEAKRPNVQIGDPYYEKLLIESCLEVIRQDLVLAIQDMGAAGLTSSSFEMAAKSEIGMSLNLDQVPLRDATMTAEEILLSESQERMLLICHPEKLERIQKIFSHWGLDAAPIGHVEAKCEISLSWKGQLLTKIDPRLLVDNAPVYERQYQLDSLANSSQADSTQSKQSASSQANLLSSVQNYFSSPAGGSRQSIYRQYDQRVGLRTARGCGEDVGFVQLPTGRGLSVAVGCRPWLMRIDAVVGAWDAVFYPSWQMAVKGAKVLAVTDCLNFANPEKKEIMSQFVASVESICDASVALSAPVISGNVSFYNETKGQGITSTPATGLIGLRNSVENIPYDVFQNNTEATASDQVYLIDFSQITLLDAKSVVGKMDSGKMAQAMTWFLKMLESHPMQATQVVGAGGLAVTLAKMCQGGVGFVLDAKPLSDLQDLFSEKLYQVVVQPNDGLVFETDMKKSPWPVQYLGKIGGQQLQLGDEKIDLSNIISVSENALKNYFTGL